MSRRLLVLFVFSLIVAGAGAEVRLPGWFGNHMVLQRGKPVPIWGWDTPGQTVTVSFAGQQQAAVAGEDGRWLVRLAPLDASAEGRPLTVAGSSTVTLEDLLVGEVWLCSGQSNMAWTVAGSRRNAAEDDPIVQAAAAADFPAIRQVKISSVTSAEGPQDDVKGIWTVCSPATINSFTAVGFFFGREVHLELGVPVGLISSNWGGTPAEAWTRLAALEAEPRASAYLEQWRNNVAAWDEAKAQATYEKQLAAWEPKAAAAKAAGEKVPPKPRRAAPPLKSPGHPATLYNGMIAPLVPYAIRGAIWYQGEANAGRAWSYRTIFPAMIADWRQQWQDDFAFGFVQLANFMQVAEQPRDHEWADVREAQAQALALPNTGMACIIDIGETGNIHPRNKLDVGDRLARWALATVYGKEIAYSGPIFKTMTVAAGKATIRFDHLGGGLIPGKLQHGFGPAVADEGAKLQRFQIAGEDKVWHWAEAVIDGETVVVSSPEVAAPVAVRYAWAANPEGANLYNRAGLPAVPFRTDDWPLPTDPQ